MPRQRQIIAVGGGGFSTEPGNSALATYILKQTGVPRPRVCFVPTASGDAVGYIEMFNRILSRFDCQTSHLKFFDRTPDLPSLVLNQDLIYVGGGNTKSMLAVWREWGMDVLLKQAWESGIIMAGTSAGAICWFEQGITDSFAHDLNVLNCMGFLKGSCCPHYDSEPDRRPSFHRMLRENRILPGYALDDCAAIHFKDSEIYRVVASRPVARAYRMRFADGAVREEPLETEFLLAP